MIDDTSPAGSWRAAMSPNATCALCHQHECAHSDAEYAGAPTTPERTTDADQAPTERQTA